MSSIEEKMRNLLREITDLDSEEEDGIVSAATRKVAGLDPSRVTEEQLLDSLLTVFDGHSRENSPSTIVVDDPDDFEQILSTIAHERIRTAGNTLNLATGKDGETYDEKSRTYQRKGRGRKTQQKEKMDAELLYDGAHDDPGFGPATEAKGTHRTTRDMLTRQ